MFLFHNKVHKSNSKLSKTNALKPEGYIILDHISQGSFGEVRHAKFLSEENDYKLVVKIIDTNETGKEYVSKFLPRELDVIQKIKHPYIIQTHSILLKKAILYIFMANAGKGELMKYIMSNGPLKENQARIWFRQITLAVQYLHIVDIVHRDIKCENIVITENFIVKLTDFGFSKFIKRSKILNCDTYCCSMPYAAPEVLSKQPYDGKSSDTWSLGVVLYVMLNKKMPFNNKNIKLMHRQQIKRNWSHQPSVEKLISENVKICMSNILQPDLIKRWTIKNILDSDWIKMNKKLIKMNEQESLALKEAIRKKKIIYPKHLHKIEANRSDTQQILNRQPLRYLSITQKVESISNLSNENSNNNTINNESTHSQHTVHAENLLSSKISKQSQHTLLIENLPLSKSSIRSQHTVHTENLPSSKTLTHLQHTVHVENLLSSKSSAQLQHTVQAENLLSSKSSTRSQHIVLDENLRSSKISKQSQHTVNAENLLSQKGLTQLQEHTVHAENLLSSKSINYL